MLIREAYAQGIVNATNANPLSDLEKVFGNVLVSILALAGIVLFIMLIIGGFRYISSGGDPKAAESARNTLTYAIGGIVVIAVSFLILRLISTFTGVNDLTNFVINR